MKTLIEKIQFNPARVASALSVIIVAVVSILQAHGVLDVMDAGIILGASAALFGEGVRQVVTPVAKLQGLPAPAPAADVAP